MECEKSKKLSPEEREKERALWPAWCSFPGGHPNIGDLVKVWWDHDGSWQSNVVGVWLGSKYLTDINLWLLSDSMVWSAEFNSINGVNVIAKMCDGED